MDTSDNSDEATLINAIRLSAGLDGDYVTVKDMSCPNEWAIRYVKTALKAGFRPLGRTNDWKLFTNFTSSSGVIAQQP